jgi:hypothetical protein
MNERILDLAIQAKDWAYADHDGYTAQMLFEQKFAELIVKECMSLVSEPGPDMNDTERGILAQIKQHFGVK